MTLQANPERDAYARKILALKPVGYWPLRSDAVDLGDLKNHGAALGAPRFVEGDGTGGWLELDGASSIEVKNHAAYSIPTSGRGLTVDVWMKPATLSHPAGAGKNYYLHWLGKGEVFDGVKQHEWAFRLYDDQAEKFPQRVCAYAWSLIGKLGSGAHTKRRIDTLSWRHFVACFDPPEQVDSPPGVQLYENGVPQQRACDRATRYVTYNVVPMAGAAALRFGTRSLSKPSLQGGIAEVALYDFVLDADEIARHHECGRRAFG